MEFHKLPCIYHPQLPITNFCQDQQCLMPLCPTCIREHTMYHQQIDTKASYYNVYESLAQTHTLVRNSIYNLQKDKERNSNLIFKIERLPAIIHQKIAIAKAQALRMVQEAFIQLEKDAFQIVQKINQEMQMHSLRKCQSYQQTIIQNLQQLYDLEAGLNTQRCLADMIYYLKQKKIQIDQLHNKLSHYLYTNQNYDPVIEINKEALQSLGLVVSRMFKFDGGKQKFDKFFDGEKMDNLVKRKTKIADQYGGNYPQTKKKIVENAFHISLTPSKYKAEQLSRPKILNQQASLSNMNMNQRNSPYRNHNQYKDIISSIDRKPQLSPIRYTKKYENMNDNKQLSRRTPYQKQYQILNQKVAEMKKQNERLKQLHQNKV